MPPGLVEQVGLVDHEHGQRARLLNGHQVPVDQPRVQRRSRGRYHHDHDVHVGRDRPPALGHVRVGARQQSPAGQDRGDAVRVVPPLDEHVVAHGELALLAAREP